MTMSLSVDKGISLFFNYLKEHLPTRKGVTQGQRQSAAPCTKLAVATLCLMGAQGVR